jgi:formylglycine-generating enzyme required for sulfatase activity
MILFACQSFPFDTKQQDQRSQKQSVISPQLVIEKDPGVMVLIPAGTFTMGNENGNSDEKPSHAVYSDAFYIDSAEVTCERYGRLLEDTA